MTKITHLATIYPGPRVVIFRKEKGYRVYHPTRASQVRLSFTLEFLYQRDRVLLRPFLNGMITVFHILPRTAYVEALRKALGGLDRSDSLERRGRYVKPDK